MNNPFTNLRQSIGDVAVITFGLAAVAAIATVHLFDWKKTKEIKKVGLSDIVGNTPLIYLPRLSKAAGSDIYVKLQYMNPFGSSKDRAIKQILTNQSISQYTEIVEASSGSTAISLVHMGHIMNKKVTIFLPNDLSEEKYNILQTLKAKINKVPPVSIVDSNHFVNLAKKYSEQRQCFYTNQFQNLENSKAHELTTGPQIYRQTNGLVDIFICSAGTGGTLAGVSKYLKSQNKAIKTVLSDTQGSSLFNKVKYNVMFTEQLKEGKVSKNPFYSVVQGIGLNRSTANLETAIIDDAEKVTDLEALHMAHYLIENEGLFVGGSSALNLVAAVKQARKTNNKNIVTIIHDNGIRYIKKFYSQSYLKQKKVNFIRKVYYDCDDLSFVK